MRMLIESTLVCIDGIIDSPERSAIFDDDATQLSMQELDNYDAFLIGRRDLRGERSNLGGSARP